MTCRTRQAMVTSPCPMSLRERATGFEPVTSSLGSTPHRSLACQGLSFERQIGRPGTSRRARRVASSPLSHLLFPPHGGPRRRAPRPRGRARRAAHRARGLAPRAAARDRARGPARPAAPRGRSAPPPRSRRGRLDSRQWGTWLSKNFELSKTTAWRYMRLAELPKRSVHETNGLTLAARVVAKRWGIAPDRA